MQRNKSTASSNNCVDDAGTFYGAGRGYSAANSPLVSSSTSKVGGVAPLAIRASRWTSVSALTRHVVRASGTTDS